MRVLHVCSELYPLLKTGGLADVASALPPALTKLGCDCRVIVPGFPAFMNAIKNKILLTELQPRLGANSISLYYGQLPNTDIYAYIVDAPSLYNRPGNPYNDEHNQAYPDNYRRFALLSLLATWLADGLDPFWRPQVIHGHDWHAGLVSAYLKAYELTHSRKLAGSVLTIHNLAYQGVFPAHVFAELELPSHFFDMNGLEFYGQVSFLKSGIFFSDKLTTVSPTYAREIQGGEQGCGLNGLLSSRRYDLHGILNGVDPEVWNPTTDSIIPANYSIRSMTGKLKCKAILQEETGLKIQADAVLFAVVSRLTEQKGLNLVLAGLDEIINRGGQVVLLGSGDAQIEAAFKEVAATHKGAVTVRFGYDEAHAHRIIAGSDVILVPSRFEPCGLTQLYGLKYGTLPLVHRVGGLADSVVDASLENLADGIATGFMFDQFEISAFNAAVRRAFALYNRKPEWKRVQKYAMQQNFSWDAAAQQFFSLYQQVAVQH